VSTKHTPLRKPPHESEVQPQRRMLGNTHGPGAAAGRTKRMPDERADGGGPGGKRRKKERAESTVPASTKDADRVLSPSVPKKRIRKLCEHKRQRSKCKDCGGSSICEHQRQRSKCKDCGGGGPCEHNRVRSSCKDCLGGGTTRTKNSTSDAKTAAVPAKNRVVGVVPAVACLVENTSTDTDDGRKPAWQPAQEGTPRSNAGCKRSDSAMQNGWREYIAASGRLYYYHKATKTTQWEYPT